MAFLQSCEDAFSSEARHGGQAVEEEVKINQAGEGFPGREELLRFFVAGTFAQTEMLLEFVPAADVVTGKNIQAAHAAKERVFGGPSADSANGGEARERGGVVEVVERFEIYFAGGDGTAEFENRALFLLTVTHGAESAGRNAGQIFRRRATVERVGCGRDGLAERLHETIQKHDADVKGNLLAGDSVEQGFENRRVTRRFETGEFGDERLEMFLSCGKRVEGAEINLSAKKALDYGAQNCFGVGGNLFCRGSDAEARARRRTGLLDGEFDDGVFDCERAAICLTVPAIEKIFRTAAKDPRSEIKAKGRCGAHLERNCVERERRADSGGSGHSFLWTFSAFGIISRIGKQCKCGDQWVVSQFESRNWEAELAIGHTNDAARRWCSA